MSSPVDILRQIKDGSIEPQQISLQVRRDCVQYLRHEGYTHQEIAEIFKVSRQTIIRDEKAIRAEHSILVKDLDIDAIAGELIVVANNLMAKLIRNKDYFPAWKIQCDLITKLQSLGYLPKAAEKLNLNVTSLADLIKLAEENQDNTKQINSEILDNEPKTPLIEPEKDAN